MRWLDRINTGQGPATIAEFLHGIDDVDLATRLARLQRAAVDTTTLIGATIGFRKTITAARRHTATGDAIIAASDSGTESTWQSLRSV